MVGLDSSSLQKKQLCQYHFEDTDFTNSTKKRLKKNAIPKLYSLPNFTSLKVITPQKVYFSGKNN